MDFSQNFAQSKEAPKTSMGLPRTIDSLCPECLSVIPATLSEKDGRVVMVKTCPVHGDFDDLISSDSTLFLKLERAAFDGSVALGNTPVGEIGDCPNGCGICAGHQSNASMTNLDLTNRCNLRCPFCFANANVQPYVYEPDLDQIGRMMDRTLAIEPRRMQAIQFSGGEPTLSPHFIDACRMARERGIKMIQAATNGIRFAREPEFAQKAADAGLNAAYLQFDGVTDDVYQVTRGVKGLWAIKQRAVEACRQAGIRITLVPTMVKGVNDHQIGDILQFAIANIDTIVGVAPQPVAFTGRIDRSERMSMRYTAADVAHDIERQTGMLEARRDWYPFNVTIPFGQIMDNVLGPDANGFLPMVCNSHPDCGVSSYLMVNERTGQTVPLNRLFDIEETLSRLKDLVRKTETNRSRLYATAQFMSLLLKTYNPQNAPEGLNVIQLAKTIDAISGKRMMGIARKSRYEWRLLLIASMHFMDAYNYQVERVKRCTIHYSTPGGKIYPFCTYNSGPVYRERVEKDFSIPKAEWVKRRGGQYVTEGFMGS